MPKKKILFLADSAADLFNLYDYIKSDYEITWIVYYDDVVHDLKKKGISQNNIFCVNPFGFLKGNFFLFILIKKILKIFYKNIFKKNLIYKVKKIDENFRPNMWVTDTIDILSKIKTQSPRCAFNHSVTFKKFFTNDNMLNYDYIFLPGEYHLERILSLHKKKINREKLIVSGSLKVSSFVKKPTLDNFEKEKIMDKYELSRNKKNILFAPTYDAFGFHRFLPKSFGNQFKAIEVISNFICSNLECNFIIKLHHYQSSLLKNKMLKKINHKKNNMVFNLAKFHDVIESENIIRLSDIIITDTSGIGPIGIFLGKKIIFLEPDSPFSWNEADMESNLRPGFICKKFDDLYQALEQNLNSEDQFVVEREKFVKKIFFDHKKNACNEISKNIKKIIYKN